MSGLAKFFSSPAFTGTHQASRLPEASSTSVFVGFLLGAVDDSLLLTIVRQDAELQCAGPGQQPFNALLVLIIPAQQRNFNPSVVQFPNLGKSFCLRVES